MYSNTPTRHFDVEQKSKIFSPSSRGTHFTASRSVRAHSNRDSLRCVGRGGACLDTPRPYPHILHLLVPESQLEKASQTLSSLLPEYAVTDPRSDYAGGWPLMPGEKEKFQEQGRFPHASPLSRRLVHTGLDSEKEAQQTQNARRQTHIPEYYPHTRFLLPLGRHGLYIDIQTRLFTRTHPTLSHRRSLSSASDHV